MKKFLTILLLLASISALAEDLVLENNHAKLVFAGGRFLGEFVPTGDNPEVDIPGYQKTHKVMGAIWENVRGGQSYIIVNMDTADHQVVLPDGRNFIIKARQAKKQWK